MIDQLKKLVPRPIKHGLGVLGAAATAGAGVGAYAFNLLPAVPHGPELTATVSAAGAGGYAVHRKFRDNSPDIALVGIEDTITRDPGPGSTGADELSDLVREANEDEADILLLVINTPGGEVVASDDIRRAVADFDGRTIAYADGLCASGGYLIASECDDIVAHPQSRLGSIGVIASRPNVSGLAEELGISYERFVAGDMKDAGSPLKEPTPEDREAVQSLVDGLYESFVETVAMNRGLGTQMVRDTEARMFLAEDAMEHQLVDEIMGYGELLESICEGGWLDAEDVDDADLVEYEMPPGLADVMTASAEQVAQAAGTGVGKAIASSDQPAPQAEYR